MGWTDRSGRTGLRRKWRLETRAKAAFAIVFAFGAGPALAQSSHGSAAGAAGRAEAAWLELAKTRCAPEAANDPVIYSQDFRWGYSLPELRDLAKSFYVSPKRLHERAYFDPAKGRFELPFRGEQGGAVALPVRLLESVRRHLEAAFERGYVDGVFFPDMGHSHFYLPQDAWDRDYASIPISQTARLYEKMMDDPRLRVLYHTAEQLQTLDPERQPLPDRAVQWRFHTRNLLGDNRGQGTLEIRQQADSKANTLSELAGHKLYSAGFNLSANERGCFPFEVGGETRWFDLSLSDLPPDPTKPFQGDVRLLHRD